MKTLKAKSDKGGVSSKGTEPRDAAANKTPQEPVLVRKTAETGTRPVRVGDVLVGAGELVVVAGPCSVESRSQLLEVAHALSEAGVQVLRGGAFKPRTSPYSFQGLGIKGLEALREAGNTYDMPVVSEVMDQEQLNNAMIYLDMLQIGARNMFNYPLLKEAGRAGLPVLLKRGLMATIKELLWAAEYIILEGNSQVILCERGIRTFETSTRNTLDISAVPVIKSQTGLPVCVDPSHAAGHRDLVAPLARAAAAAGAHAIMLEVHPDPDKALSDGHQSLTVKQAVSLIKELARISKAVSEVRDEKPG